MGTLLECNAVLLQPWAMQSRTLQGAFLRCINRSLAGCCVATMHASTVNPGRGHLQVGTQTDSTRKASQTRHMHKAALECGKQHHTSVALARPLGGHTELDFQGCKQVLACSATTHTESGETILVGVLSRIRHSVDRTANATKMPRGARKGCTDQRQFWAQRLPSSSAEHALILSLRGAGDLV